MTDLVRSNDERLNYRDIELSRKLRQSDTVRILTLVLRFHQLKTSCVFGVQARQYPISNVR